jgi:TRAP-type C4-dicarboxylate transport system substrate-binding protein
MHHDRAHRGRFLGAAVALLGGLVMPLAGAAEPTTLKIATIAPKGSVYHRVLQDLGEAFRGARGAPARAIVYPDGVQGTEADMVRRMRVGQVDAALLTVVGLNEIDPTVSALQFMPMVFRTWEEVDYVREKLRPVLTEKLASKGFVVLLWGDAGWVHFFMRERMTLPDEFARARIFAWSGDNAQIGLMKTLGYRPVGLPISDIVPALETGMIDVVPVVPIWALVGQLDRLTRYMLPVHWVPIVGAAVMRKATFDALAPATRSALLAAASKAEGQLRATRVSQDAESIRAMQGRGLEVLPLDAEADKAWRALAARAWPHVRGGLVPAEMFDRVQSLLAQYRADHP